MYKGHLWFIKCSFCHSDSNAVSSASIFCSIDNITIWYQGSSVIHSRMNWWNSPWCEFYRSVRNAVKLTKCWEILWSEPFRGLLWPNLWSEAGHIWARTTFPFICCAAGIGLHNCRHYNWLACVQPGLSAQKVNTTVKNNQSVIDASLHIIRNLSS